MAECMKHYLFTPESSGSLTAQSVNLKVAFPLCFAGTETSVAGYEDIMNDRY
jgi:hypothetical protein